MMDRVTFVSNEAAADVVPRPRWSGPGRRVLLAVLVPGFLGVVLVAAHRPLLVGYAYLLPG